MIVCFVTRFVMGLVVVVFHPESNDRVVVALFEKPAIAAASEPEPKLKATSESVECAAGIA